MALNPNNLFQNVATYQDPSLAYLDNMNVFIPTLNTTYLNFQNRTAQLGATVNLELPYRYRSANGLVVSFQPTQQRLHPLSVMQAKNVAFAFAEQDFIYNAEEFMNKFGFGAIEELSNSIEMNVALNATSHVPVMELDGQGQSVPTGALKVENGPFRFYGDGVTDISTIAQLAEMEAFFEEYGAAKGKKKCYLPNMAVPAIINSSLSQFTPSRNDKLAMSWDLGTYNGSNCNFYKSNLLPVHTAGSLGDDKATLTVVSINAAGTEMVLSGAGTASKAIRSGDLGQFLPSAGLNFLTFIGHSQSQCPVQFRALADADSSAGNVTVSITPALVSDSSSPNQNLNKAIVAGMQLQFMPSHKAGLLVGGDAFYLAMPQLGMKTPYPTSNKKSDLTGVSIRHYYGHMPFGNTEGYVMDCVFDTALLQDYCMRVLFPL
jgi:hypothetical protein